MSTVPWQDDPVPDYPPIHILVGVGRSGTSYLGNQMKSGFDMTYPTEPKVIVPLFHRLERYGELTRADNMRRLCQSVIDSGLFFKQRRKGPVAVDELLERIQEPNYRGVIYASFRLLADKEGKRRYGYKDPFDHKHIDLLSRILPTSRFIHIIRDGRDVAISTCRQDWGPTNLYTAAHTWALGIDKAQADGAALGSRYLELRLEDLVLDTRNTATRLAHFFNGAEDPEETEAFVRQIEASRNPGVLSPWKKKLSSRQVRLCEAAAGEQLRRCGYELSFEGTARVSPLTGLAYRGLDIPIRGTKAIARRFRGGFKKAS